MEYLQYVVDLFLHLDKHLHELIGQLGVWVYLVLFLVIFAETGLVFTPFLPGDSLLFAAGAIAGGGALDPHILFLLLTFAGVLGDTVNYWIGKYLGPKLLRDQSRFLKREYLDRTHAFFEKYGGKTIIIARFVPIVRTFAPFVAGIGAMTYAKFLFYNVIGAVLWVGICVYAGYIFGGFEIVKKNFTLVVLAIILISILPALIEIIRHRREAAAAAQRSAAAHAPPQPVSNEP